MSWRTVVVSSRCKLDLKMGYMVIRGNEVQRIFLDEIAVLIIENPAVAMTGNLLVALTEKKIKVVLCDLKRSPCAELLPYYGAHDSSKKIRQQIGWQESLKLLTWSEIITNKIYQQARHLGDIGKEAEAEMLFGYMPQVEPGDITNREGHSAKVYFNALFGKSFSRRSSCVENAALNYGYGIVLSAFNREVTATGYLTQLGLHHTNIYNHFNLSSDLMEPYRVLVDRKVSSMALKELDHEAKLQLVGVLNDTVVIEGTKQTVLNSIKIYCKSVFDCLNSGRIDELSFFEI